MKNIKCWQVWLADIPINEKTHRQGKIRPVVIISNDRCNYYSDYLSIIPFTSNLRKKILPTHLYLTLDKAQECGIDTESILLCEQVGGLDKWNLIHPLGEITDEELKNEIKEKTFLQLFDEDNLVMTA